MQVQVSWANALAFDLSAPDSAHTIRIDASIESGGTDTGLNPKKLLLGSLCGCSGIDVVDILKKMKVPFEKIEITASADKVARAVSLSHEKYCGISAMLAKHCPITYEIGTV